MAAKIMLMRHAEKPGNGNQGINEKGIRSDDSLTVQGWMRAGALAQLLAPAGGAPQRPQLATPNSLFASGNKSQRPQQTIAPLAAKLGLQVNTTFKREAITDLAGAVRSSPGVVLVSWQHEYIPSIANAIVGNATTCPQTWNSARFDLIWVVDCTSASGYSFAQVPQFLLAGDQG